MDERDTLDQAQVSISTQMLHRKVSNCDSVGDRTSSTCSSHSHGRSSPNPPPPRRKRRQPLQRWISDLPNPYIESDQDDFQQQPRNLDTVLREIHNLSHSRACATQALADAWNALGLIRLHIQIRLEDAIHCHETALRFYKAGHQKAVCLADMACCYERQRNVTKARALYVESLGMLSEKNNCMRQSVERSLARMDGR